MTKNLSFLLSVALLSACHFELPHPAAAQEMLHDTRSGTSVSTVADDLRCVQWWKRMHDPVLNQLIKTALRQNNQIKTAQANVLQAQAKLAEARFAWLPTLNLSGNGFVGGGWDTHFSPQGPLSASPVFNQMGGIHFKGYYSGFVPTYTVNVLANMHQTRFAQAALELQHATYQAARLSVISQVSGAYFMLLGEQAQRSLQRQLIHDLEKQCYLERSRYKHGGSDLTRLTQVDQQLAEQRAALPAIENSIAQLENAIQVLLNRNPAPLMKQGRFSRLRLKGVIPAHLPSTVLQHRPDLMSAKAQLLMAEQRVGLAYANFFPTISLTGLLGSASFELSHLLSISTGLWIAQAAASMPLLNGVSYAQIRAEKSAYYAAFYTYLHTLRSVFADVNNQLTNHVYIDRISLAKAKALQEATRTYHLALSRYHAGARDYREVAQAKYQVDLAKLALILAKMQQLDSIVQVYQAVGGGHA